MEPTRIIRRESGDDFDRDLEKKFQAGIDFGPSGIDFIRHVKFNTEDTSIARYYKGNKTKNLKGQYVLIEVPDAAITASFQVKHDLKRSVTNVIIVAQAGIDRTTYPYTLKDTLYGLITRIDNSQNWNEDTITLSAARLYSSGYPQRMLLLLI
jgi:hypothetical protein